MLNVFPLTRDAEFRTRVVTGCCMNASSPLRSGALDDERFLWEILGSAVHFIVMLRFDKVRSQSSFAFDVYRTSTFTLIATFFQFPGGVFCDLYPPNDTAAVHSACYVHRVAPDVVLRLLRSHHTGDDRAVVDSYSQLEPLERLPVDLFKQCHECNGELDQADYVVIISWFVRR